MHSGNGPNEKSTVSEKETKELRDEINETLPKVVEWDGQHSWQEHRRYSNTKSTMHSNRVLVVLLGEDCEEEFNKVIKSPTNSTIEKEFSKLIGIEIMQLYSQQKDSEGIQNRGLEKSALNFDLIFARNYEMLDDKDPSDYFAIMFAQSSNIDYENTFKWLEEGTSDESPISMIFSFSNILSKRIKNQEEETLSNIANTWIVYDGELNEQEQINLTLLTVKNLFFDRQLGSIPELVQDIRIDAIANDILSPSLCKNLQSFGEHKIDVNILEVINNHVRSYSVICSKNPPKQFAPEGDNIRNGRDAWCSDIIEKAQNDYENDVMNEELFIIDAIHHWHPEQGNPHLENNGTVDDLVDFYVRNHKAMEPSIDFRVRFPNSHLGHSSSNLYGSKSKNKEKKRSLERWFRKFDEIETLKPLLEHQGLSRNLHPKFFKHIYDLFQIVSTYLYQENAKSGDGNKLDNHFKEKMSLTNIISIQRRISKNLFQEWVIDFKKAGGWC